MRNFSTCGQKLPQSRLAARQRPYPFCPFGHFPLTGGIGPHRRSQGTGLFLYVGPPYMAAASLFILRGRRGGLRARPFVPRENGPGQSPAPTPLQGVRWPSGPFPSSGPRATCPYPLCPFGTSPLDKGSRPPGEGLGADGGTPPLRCSEDRRPITLHSSLFTLHSSLFSKIPPIKTMRPPQTRTVSYIFWKFSPNCAQSGQGSPLPAALLHEPAEDGRAVHGVGPAAGGGHALGVELHPQHGAAGEL